MLAHDAVRRLASVTIGPGEPVLAAVRRLDAAGSGALLVCDDGGVLVGIVTDGDIRRAILRGVSFDAAVGSIATSRPVVGAAELSERAALELMDHAAGFPVHQLPLVDDAGRAAGLLLRRDLVSPERLGLSALIMAGGLGTRMLPLTETVPKPMLRICDRPLLERTVSSLKRAGISRVAISTAHLADRITTYFGDGRALGVDLQYVSEIQPLGTAGALRLLEDDASPTLVINGDILPSLPFPDLVAFHRREGAELTVGMRRCELHLPYGVLDCDGARIRAVREKPRQSFWANAGIYVVEPSVRDLIPEAARFDMTDLIEKLLADGRRVAGFPILEYWLDIGQPADYIRAEADSRAARVGPEDGRVAVQP